MMGGGGGKWNTPVDSAMYSLHYTYYQISSKGGDDTVEGIFMAVMVQGTA